MTAPGSVLGLQPSEFSRNSRIIEQTQSLLQSGGSLLELVKGLPGLLPRPCQAGPRQPEQQRTAQCTEGLDGRGRTLDCGEGLPTLDEAEGALHLGERVEGWRRLRDPVQQGERDIGTVAGS